MSDFQYEPPVGTERLQEQLKSLPEQTKTWSQLITESIQKFDEIIRPWVEAAEAWLEKIKQMSLNFEIPASLKVIGKLAASQYVFWDYFTEAFIDDALNGYDINFALFDYESEDGFARSESVIKECAEHAYLQSHLLLFSQAIDAYHEEKYNLAAVGLTAVIDAVLSEATHNLTHKPKDRCEAILDKLKANEYVADEEYATLTLFVTFGSMATSFYKPISFSENEPNDLNRHWIMHGRTLAENTRLVCIKLLRFLYAIIISNYIDEQRVVTENAPSET